MKAAEAEFLVPSVVPAYNTPHYLKNEYTQLVKPLVLKSAIASDSIAINNGPAYYRILYSSLARL